MSKVDEFLDFLLELKYVADKDKEKKIKSIINEIEESDAITNTKAAPKIPPL